ncbi:hypothetical protein O181_042246 [Austropuccinia psidii MF-1]|uniref:Uncharacterized protein n=1 Tax=Austropuccinia psidii MF-1 TaxID=1389203 RepID=A0A9Q3DEI4_9BASI|nr:hypothetical protein [Austropuccinia psidii MF-1]
MENAFESAIFNSEKDKPLTWFLKQKERLLALHPDMSDSMTNMKILRNCGGKLEHDIKVPLESKIFSKTSREDKRPKRPVLKCHKCGITSNLANTRTKKTNINEVQVIEEVQCTEEEEESDLDSAVSADTPSENYPIENITAFFQISEVHTHLPQYIEDCHNLINIQDARICKTKPARGKQ